MHQDPSSLLSSGSAPPDWNDVTFLRQRGPLDSNDGWLCAVTSRHKLILSERDEPWLLDQEADPDELSNFIDDESRKPVVRHLARELAAYCKRYDDPYGANPNTAADLARLAR